MDKQNFMQLMNFPSEWEEFGMYPDELYEMQVAGYAPGHEDASEHDRNGAFHWWLKREPSKQQLISLAKLSYLDPEPLMGEDIRSYIRKANNFDSEVERYLLNAT